MSKTFELTKYQTCWYNERMYAVNNPQHPHYNHNTQCRPEILTQLENDEDKDDNFGIMEYQDSPFVNFESTMEVDEDTDVPVEVSYPELLNLWTEKSRERFIPLCKEG